MMVSLIVLFIHFEKSCTKYFAEVFIGLETKDYQVEEGHQARLCATLMNVNSDCIVSFPFSIFVDTEYGRGIDAMILGSDYTFLGIA